MKLIRSHKILCLLIASLAIGFISPDSVIAAEKKDKAARRAALMVQKMEQEKASMQAEFELQKKVLEDKLKASDEELQKVNTSLVAAKRKVNHLETDLSKINAEKTALETKQLQTQTQLETTQTSLADLTVLYKLAQTDLKFNDNQRKTLSTNLAQTTQFLNTCEEKNTKLHQFGTELIKIYDIPNAYESVMRKEKFFQLKRVELENILQNRQDQLDDARVSTKKTAHQ
ncbi:MAG TPA: hypothetical protein VES38_06495 [Methylotenera sp.]|nr:hypothetical protein [Methylotenera sp.]